MSELTREQFQKAVAAAIAGVEHLYREVDLLIARLREELAEEPEPLTVKRGTLGKAGREDSKRLVVRYEYGALFEPAVDDDDDDDDGDGELDDDDPAADDDDDDEGDSRATRKGKKQPHEIVAGQPLLAVRIAMFDPRKRSTFEPHIQFAVMTDWALGDAPAQADERFRLQAYMLKRVARTLADRTGPPSAQRVRTGAAARSSAGAIKGKSRKLTCLLPAGVKAVALYSINSADALEKLAGEMKNMWTSVAGG